MSREQNSKAKDQDPGPTLPSTKDLAGSDFPKLESQLPNALRSTNRAKYAKQFANLGEGNIHTVVGYLYFVQDTSKGTSTVPPKSETCNCKLKAPNTLDYHLGLGFDSALAANARSTHPKPGDADFSKLEKQSVVAEMTPYTRHAKWSFSRVDALQGQQVKVVGQLMVDNIHFNKNDDCHFSPPQSGGESEKALGHEPQIDRWLTAYNRRACSVSKLIGVVATKEDATAEMEQSNQTSVFQW